MTYPYYRVIPPHIWKGSKVKGSFRYDVTKTGKVIPRINSEPSPNDK